MMTVGARERWDAWYLDLAVRDPELARYITRLVRVSAVAAFFVGVGVGVILSSLVGL